ncbi:hypothetical protein CLOSYM_02756 [[Clostridium] symbiosum ATCC 14940]|uniref:Uncharacterized protein n=1 Tax=[Clostridium] symbiosum ATCC 14940 TaxID=411472 RepID=A0ABC9TWK9_CLOSY|nr:hypothetical protein CLOSYM_02756 [[Clostridium] symbiosum ATCC 14940]
MSSGRVASSHPAFNLHTFRLCDFFGFWNNVSVSHRANEPIYLVHGTSFRVRQEKGNTGGHSVAHGQENSQAEASY